MKVTGPNRTSSTKTSKTKQYSSVSDSSFSSMVKDSVKADVASTVEHVDGINSLPDALSGESPEYQAQEHAKNILEHLEKLQMGLITGSISETSLRNLSDIVGRYKNNTSDVELGAILDDIHLRAEVELAKYMRDKS